MTRTPRSRGSSACRRALLIDERMPDTGFSQPAASCRAQLGAVAATQIVVGLHARRARTAANRWDQILGGDGNLIAELNDLTLDLVYVRSSSCRPAGSITRRVTYSFNTQREERVNQGGNGQPDRDDQPRAGAHDGARPAGQRLDKQLSPRQTLLSAATSTSRG